MSKFQDAMRRVITGDNAQGQSVIIIDGGPSSEIGSPDLGGLFEIWEDAAFGALTPSAALVSLATWESCDRSVPSLVTSCMTIR